MTGTIVPTLGNSPFTKQATPAHVLRSTTSTYRLNLIDKIRANGVGEHVSLPQLVVCGDQSAGKSSVLERVAGIPFPRREGLCTRFPTEIILRHSNEPLRISASIVPSTCSSLEEQETLRRYRRQLADISELPAIIDESAALMGIRGYGDAESANAFSHHVLRIEIVGPTDLHLTIVDLPGLISVSNDEQTDEDVQVVAELVERYLANSRTIIMSVLQASNDIANQRIVQLARKYDPAGQRTVGIITKPDLINQGAEGQVAKWANNQDAVKLKLGFFLLKNPSPADIKAGMSGEDASRRETDFFSRPPWKQHNLDKSRVGAEALRLFLQDLLDRHIEKELPKVQDEVKRQLAVTEAELASMGMERPTVGHVRSFLTGLSMQFHQLAQAALDGNYQGPDQDFFKSSDTRLRAMIHEANGSYADFMRKDGQKRKISTVSPASDTESTDENETQQLYVTKEEMTAWVKEVYTKTRGRELPGNYNHVLLAELFHEQSSNWPTIAEGHLRDVLGIVSRWIGQAVDAAVREEAVNQEVHIICRANLREAEKRAAEELARLAGDEKRHPITYNHYYTDNIQRARHNGQEAAIERALRTVKDEWGGKLHISNQAYDMEKLLQAIRGKVVVNMDQQACSEALEALNAYYKVAMKTFVDNVCRQVIERHLLSVLPMLFCPTTVSQLGDVDLVRIGSEPETRKVRRAELDSLAHGLRQSLADLQSPARG